LGFAVHGLAGHFSSAVCGLIGITREKGCRAHLGDPSIHQPIIRQYLPRCKARLQRSEAAAMPLDGWP
jgi:hypothetical protein